LVWREWKMSRLMNTPQVRVNAQEAEIDKEIVVGVELEFLQYGHRDVTVSLQCQFLRQGKNAKTETISEQKQPAKAMSGNAIGVASDRLTFKIPPHAQATTARRGLPGYSWRIAVAAKMEDQKELYTYFPLVVK
jgi:hypothetical protein